MIDSSGGRLAGRGQAEAGVIMGWIGVAFAVISVLFIVLVVVAGVSSS